MRLLKGGSARPDPRIIPHLQTRSTSTWIRSRHSSMASACERARYLFGGYAENRRMYRRTNCLIRTCLNKGPRQEETRSLHLGMDVWGEAGTPVYAPLGGGAQYGIQRQDGRLWRNHYPWANLMGWVYSLFGHLSRARTYSHSREGHFISRGRHLPILAGRRITGTGPHLHFNSSLISGYNDGDYRASVNLVKRADISLNSPDPLFSLSLKKPLIIHNLWAIPVLYPVISKNAKFYHQIFLNSQ